MTPRFHATKGYTNDPNGLVYFNGFYHMFFQSADGRMNNLEQPVCWGHAVSRDLVQWQQVENALLPDQPYEKDRGCWSGSAVVKDDKLYLFYTGAARPCASVNVAWSGDGIHFEKYAENPVIPRGPEDADCWEFRDPKVQENGRCVMTVRWKMSGSCGIKTGWKCLSIMDPVILRSIPADKYICKKRVPFWAPHFYSLAAAAVVVTAAAVIIVVTAAIAAPGAAAVAQQEDQNDDPANITTAETVIVTHIYYLRKSLQRFSPLIPRYSGREIWCEKAGMHLHTGFIL